MRADSPSRADSPLRGTQQRLLLVLGSSSGGVVRHVEQLVNEVSETLGADLDVRIAGPTDHAARFSGRGYALVPIGPRPQLRDLVNILSLRRRLRGANVVHAHGLRAGALTVLAASTLLAARRPRIVVTLHNVTVGSWRTRFISRVLERLVARGSQVVLGVSSDIVDSVRNLGTAAVTRALIPAPNGFAMADRSPEQVRTELGIAPTTSIILTVARLAPQKGLDTLLATAQVLKDGPGQGDWVNQPEFPFIWLVAGAGPRELELAERITEANLPVRLLGSRSDVADLLAAADVVVSTAVWEGQPIGIQEALHAGAAIVATDAGGTQEVTGDDGAVIVPVGDAQQAAIQTARLLADTGLRDAQRAAARRRAQELPSPADMTRQVLDAYGWSKYSK